MTEIGNSNAKPKSMSFALAPKTLASTLAAYATRLEHVGGLWGQELDQIYQQNGIATGDLLCHARYQSPAGPLPYGQLSRHRRRLYPDLREGRELERRGLMR